MADQARTVFVVAGALPSDTLALIDAGARIRGITVINSSSADFWLFVNRQVSTQPDIIVPSGQSIGLPIANAGAIAYQAVQASGAREGYCYLHITSDLVSSTSSTVTVAAGATSYAASGYTTFPSGVVFQWGSCQAAAGHDGAFTFVLPVPLGTGIFNVVAYAQTGTDLMGVEVTGKTTTAITGNVLGGDPAGGAPTVYFQVTGI